MNYIEETVTTTDGLRLYLRRHELAAARGEVLIVHGFGEHSGRYGELMSHLVNNNYSVTAYDHRGHGLSDGLPGHVDSFGEYDEDLAKMVNSIKARTDAESFFVIGHSMGGLIALRYAARKATEISGTVVSAPLIDVAVPVPAHKLMIARVGARMAPRMRLDNEINPSYLSRDPEVGRAYAADPLVNRKVSAKWLAEAKQAMHETEEWAPLIKIPVLIMHGTDDRLASVEATQRIFERIGSEDKELELLSGYYHELFNEPERYEIFKRVTKWLGKHTADT